MSYVRGEDITMGVGIESSRGVPVTPGIWIPGRGPASLGVRVDKVEVKETRATKVSSQGAEVVKRMAGGELEYNVRVRSIGYILRSLLGSVSSATKAGESAVYQHTFGILANNPQHPSLTLALSIPGGGQDYEYALALAKNLQLSITPGDLVFATTEFLAKSEAEHSAYTPSFPSDDYYFSHGDVTIKLANDLSGLAGATPIKIKELSLSIENNASDNQNVSELNPGDIFAKNFEIGGNFAIDFQDKTYHDLFRDGTYKAMRITLNKSSQLIGTAGSPKIEIDLPKISFNSLDQDRPMDDILRDGVGFMAHYSLSDSKAISVVVENTKTNYTS